MSGRGKLIAALLVVLLMALAAGWPVADHYRLKRKLEEYKQQLRAKGERLAIAECVPARHTEDRQAIHDFLVALGRMRSPSPSDSNYPPAMKFIAPGRALVAWRQDILPTDQVSNVWPGLSARLGENQEGLAELRAALQRPVRSFDLDYSQGHEGIRFPHLPKLKEASQWLLAATILDLHEGRMSNAWKNVKALSALVEWNRDEPLTLSELVRIGICQIALNATWEAWQSSEVGEAQLRELQNTWESVDVLSQAESALAMERAISEKTFAKARESFPRTAFPPRPANTGLAELRELGEGLLEDPKQGIKAILQRYPGYWAWKWWHSYDDELASAEAVQAGLEAVRRARKEHANAPAHKQFDNEVALVKQAHAAADTWLGISSTLWGGGRFQERVSATEMQRSLLVTAIALKRYRIRHGVYPSELAELAPDFLRQPSLDSMDGQPLRYRLKPDGTFLLYSVGEDGHDDGGDATPTEPASRVNKSWWRGRDAVWPWPAATEEVGADFERVAARRTVAEQIAAAIPLATTPEAAAAEAELRKRYGLPPANSAQTNSGTNWPK